MRTSPRENFFVRTDAAQTEIIAATAFTTSIIWSTLQDMRDHGEISVWFEPTDITANTEVDIYVQWPPDNIAATDLTGNQNSDFLIATGTDGKFEPKVYLATLKSASGSLAANLVQLLSLPKKGRYCRVGFKGNGAGGMFSARSLRLA